MKTSVTNMMMGLVLTGCMIFGASDASAQGRSRSQGGSSASRSQSAAVSRSNSSTAPTVSRNSSSSVSRSSATPQVSRSGSATSRSSATPQVSHSSSTTTSRSTTTTQVRRDATTRGGSNHSKTTAPSTTLRNDNSTGRTVMTTTPNSEIKKGGNGKPGGDKGGIDNGRRGNRDGRNGNGGIGSDSRGKRDRNGNRPGNNGNNGNRPDDHNGSKDNKGHNNHNARPGDNGKHGGNHGYSPKHRYDYGGHHYRNEFAWNYSHHSWSRPLPPPVRAHRPAPLVWYRPAIPVGWHPYAGAPVIDRILGLMFGSLYEASLDHLYYSGYYIDGYADNIIYLRDVPMLNLYWPDVMLNYELGRLANAQFIYHSSYYDRARFDRVYNSLRRIYGAPVYQDGMTISWYGGNNTGWVTLTMNENYGDYYTTMSIGY